ncbi:IspD/TarI family cytidylyltransferase [Gilvimarinus algae]|uniref:2-C-methyl-D-erythritol 4-phosphate cytidylyltransferase n=1 Tax=Gilvimarinus algae TaxID=3058037 RepID=A0ABT8TCT2_9GAMM|nr:2-C-methyl-D-erythritol 4-phosphate cytidylyltransferase [Gilvimarinus sp. SDUM040014]MDO3381916.1 2-C-methyl-D-erythritol 4-phosphate cytidylyltransferase [Gilvimarinus sp. SDUM040014]
MVIKSAALIPAAGMGSRVGEGPKALLKLGGQSLVEIVVDKCLSLVDEVVVAAPAGYEEIFQRLLSPNVSVVTGGHDRYQTVLRLLEACTADYVLLQNAASPFASLDLLKRVLSAACKTGSAAAFGPSSVPVASLSEGYVSGYLASREVGVFQTPQAFSRDLVLSALHSHQRAPFQSTLEYVLAEGHSVQAIEGEEYNIKITTALDWRIAREIIAPALGLLATRHYREPVIES